MIIIEGPDRSGKTTLANYLSNVLKIPIIHSAGPAKSQKEFLQIVNQTQINFNRKLIQDRTPIISEAIYGTFRPDHKPYIIWRSSQRLMASYKHLLIYCRPPRELFDFSGEPKLVRDNADEIIKLYDRYFGQLERYYKHLELYRYDRSTSMIFVDPETGQIIGRKLKSKK